MSERHVAVELRERRQVIEDADSSERDVARE